MAAKIGLGILILDCGALISVIIAALLQICLCIKKKKLYTEP